jgi:transposase
LCPAGFSREISAGQAIDVLHRLTGHGPVADARLELAHDLVTDLRRIDAQRREVKRRLTRQVAASTTTVTEIYGVGPIIAATVLGYVGDIARFPSRDHFAAYNGTAPIEVSSGNRKIHRLSRRGNRQLNHALHMAAVTQIRNRGTAGRAYYDRKRAEGMTGKCALCALKRKISDPIYHRLVSDTRQQMRSKTKDPGGQPGNDSASSAAGSHPEPPALRKSHSRVAANPTTSRPAPQPAKPARPTKIVPHASLTRRGLRNQRRQRTQPPASAESRGNQHGQRWLENLHTALLNQRSQRQFDTGKGPAISSAGERSLHTRGAGQPDRATGLYSSGSPSAV